jgi:hypothetical protein
MVSSDSESSECRSQAMTWSSMAFDAAIYVDQASALLELSIPPELRSGVIANFEHLQSIAQPVVDFVLPETVESAATFEP